MLRILLVAILMQIPGLALADTSAALSTCVADSTSGKQRKDLARWVFLAMAAHPDLRQYASPEAGVAKEPTDKDVAKLFEILIAEQCATEANAAYQELGTPGIQVAFEMLGRLAMQELMTNADASAAMAAFERYVDSSRIDAVLNKK